VSVLCLAPVATDTLGWLLLVAGIVVLGAVARLERVSLPARHDRSANAAAGQLTLALMGTAPFVVGAIGLAPRREGASTGSSPASSARSSARPPTPGCC
jgi:hypothetical protein